MVFVLRADTEMHTSPALCVLRTLWSLEMEWHRHMSQEGWWVDDMSLAVSTMRGTCDESGSSDSRPDISRNLNSAAIRDCRMEAMPCWAKCMSAA
jgi:hypothetical protein